MTPARRGEPGRGHEDDLRVLPGYDIEVSARLKAAVDDLAYGLAGRLELTDAAVAALTLIDRAVRFREAGR